jgi:hypothetical protein
VLKTSSEPDQGNETKAGLIPATKQPSRQEESLNYHYHFFSLTPAEAAERELRRNLLPGPEK